MIKQANKFVLFLFLFLILSGLVLNFSLNPRDGGEEFISIQTNSSFNDDYNGSTIIFDASHRPAKSIWDTGVMGYSDLAILLMDNNYRVGANTQSLLEILPDLSDKDIVVLPVAKYQEYTMGEITAITDFVYRGGGLLIFAEHDDVFDMTEFQQPVCSNFGITINNDSVIDNSAHVGGDNEWIILTSGFFGLTNISYTRGASLTLQDNATAIANALPTASPASAAVAAKSTYGLGRVICVSDSEFCWNGYLNDTTLRKSGLKWGNNSQFTLKIFNWLANQSLPSNVEIIPEFSLFTGTNFILNVTFSQLSNVTTVISGGIVNPSSMMDVNGTTSWNLTILQDGFITFIVDNSSCIVQFFYPKNETPTTSSQDILFIDSNYCRKPDKSLNGLYSFARFLKEKGHQIFAGASLSSLLNYDIIVLANPLELFTPNQVNNLSNTNKIILLGESYSTTAILDWVTWVLLNSYGWGPIPSPINQIAPAYSVNFTHYLIFDPLRNQNSNPTYSKITSPNLNFDLVSYQGNLVLSNSSSFKTIASGYDSAWGEDCSWLECAGVLPSHPDNHDILRTKYDLNTTPFIVYNPNVLAIGDVDILSNEYSDSRFFDVVAYWIETGEFPMLISNDWIIWIIIIGSCAAIGVLFYYLMFINPAYLRSSELHRKPLKKRTPLQKK